MFKYVLPLITKNREILITGLAAASQVQAEISNV